MRRRPSPEPFLWLLFSTGGLVAALVIPVLLAVYGVAIPLEWVNAPDHQHVLGLVRNPLTRLALLGVCSLALFHWAHRFRYTLVDGLQLGRYATGVAVCCYGTAVVGSGAAAVVLLLA